MSTTPQERLREIRDEASKIAAKGILSEDESKTFENLMGEAEGLKGQVEQLDRFNGLESFIGQSTGRPPMAAASQFAQTAAGETVIETSAGSAGATKVSMIEQYGEGVVSNKALMASTEPVYGDAFKTYLRYGDRGLNTAQIKTLQEGQDTEGGYLVPADILNMIIAKEPTPTRIASRVTHLTTSRDTVVVPRVNYTTDDIYTSGIRSTWTGEIPASSTTARVTDPVYGQSRIPIFTNMLSIPLTMDLVEDASFDVTGWVSGKFGETINLLRDDMTLNGSGRGRPTGILNAPGADVTQPPVTNIGNPLTADGLISIGFALPEQYDNNATYVFSKTQTGPVVAKLKDSSNRYVWGSGLQDSGLSPDLHNRRLLGYEVMFSEFMPAPGANNFPVLFGDLSGYFMVNRVGLSVRVLNELYAETNQVLVIGRIRFGGIVAEPWKMRVGKQA